MIICSKNKLIDLPAVARASGSEAGEKGPARVEKGGLTPTNRERSSESRGTVGRRYGRRTKFVKCYR